MLNQHRKQTAKPLIGLREREGQSVLKRASLGACVSAMVTRSKQSSFSRLLFGKWRLVARVFSNTSTLMHARLTSSLDSPKGNPAGARVSVRV